MGILKLTNVSEASLIIPICAGVLAFKNLNGVFKTLFYFFCFSVFIEIGAEWLAYFHKNNMPLLHFFTIPEFLVYLYVFIANVDFISNKRLLIFGGLLGIFLTAFTDIYLFEGLFKFNSVTRSFESIILLFFALLHFYLFFKFKSEKIAWVEPMFWFSLSIIVYFSLNLFFFMLANLFQVINGLPIAFGSKMHSVFNTISNILFAISFKCFRKNI
jgi:hypothetical protein